MPFPVSSTRLREPHARMLAALALFSGHLLSLNDPLADQRHAAAAACALVDELRGWIAQARWTQACRAAGVRWRFEPAAQLPIIPITQHQTATGEEQPANTLAALAAAHQVRADPMGHQTARTARRRSAAAIAAQDALQLAQEADAGPPARVVPLRPAAATSAPPDLATRRRSA
jgi:hypothetical protein